jgi:hypothetical protein
MFRQLEYHFAAVPDKSRVLCLKKERADPYVLPINKARNFTVSNEEVRGVDVPMPESGSDHFVTFWEHEVRNIQELFVKCDVTGRSFLSDGHRE